MTTLKYKKKKYITLSLIPTLTIAVVMSIIGACTQQSATARPKFIFKDAPSNGLAAKIGAITVTEEELVGDASLRFYEIRKQEYDLKMSQLNNLIQDKLIGAEAKEAKLSTAEFIEKKIIKNGLNISSKEFEAFIEERKVPKAQINDSLKSRIMDFLKEKKREDLVQAYVAKLTHKVPVEVYFKKPRLNLDIKIGDAPTFGNKNAKVKIVEFSDFQCPFCARGAEVAKEIKKKYGNKVLFAFKHFPLPSHPLARPASEASECVRSLNESKFWAYHDMLFENQRKLDPEDLKEYAKKVGVDPKKFDECVSSKKFAALVQESAAYGEQLGVRSTPTFFVNGQLVSGAQPIEVFDELIQDELNQ